MRFFAALLLALLVSGCAEMNHVRGPALDRGAKWALLPILNHTEVPQAGLRAESIGAALLRGRGVEKLLQYPAAMSQEALLEPGERKALDEAKAWAKGQGARYGLTGAVDEWRYKVGVDGEPAVGLSLAIVDLETDAVLWTAVGGKSGWSREALSAVAQKLIREMLATADIR